MKIITLLLEEWVGGIALSLVGVGSCHIFRRGIFLDTHEKMNDFYLCEIFIGFQSPIAFKPVLEKMQRGLQ